MRLLHAAFDTYVTWSPSTGRPSLHLLSPCTAFDCLHGPAQDSGTGRCTHIWCSSTSRPCIVIIWAGRTPVGCRAEPAVGVCRANGGSLAIFQSTPPPQTDALHLRNGGPAESTGKSTEKAYDDPYQHVCATPKVCTIRILVACIATQHNTITLLCVCMYQYQHVCFVFFNNIISEEQQQASSPGRREGTGP